ncbi:MAG: PKD domain-containing protein, partial [Saprospiraceae bacterium]
FEGCKDTADITINVFPAINADFTFSYDTCEAGAVEFTDLSMSGAGNITKHSWLFESDEKSADKNPIYSYNSPGIKPIKLVVEDKNECKDSIIKDITWYPVPELIVIQPNQFIGCVPAKINFNNLSLPIDETYSVLWDFGDGEVVDALSPSHTYESAGSYSVSVFITSPIGCTTGTSYADWIRILDSPIAGFSYSPEQPSIFNKTVSFIDESSNAQSWSWDIGGVGSLQQNPTYTFQDTGIVRVEQIAVHETGCTDTATALIDILPLVTLHVPNAFTPNNDGLNDTFKGKGYFDGFQEFTMQIWNRWGEKIYETLDPDIGWNGQKNNAGTNSPGGVYVYTIEYIGPRGGVEKLKGHVTLIR